MYEDLLNDFKKWITTDKKVQAYWDKVKEGKATYKDATLYSEIIGTKWSKLLSDESENEEIIEALKKAYRESAYYAKNVQQIVNKKAEIGLKAQEPAIDETRISNLIEKLDEKPDALWLLSPAIISNISRSAVTDTIEMNAKFQQDAGLYTYIERDATNCCEWCASAQGRYIYGQQPADFFKTHRDCNCIITYMPSKKPIQRIRYVGDRKITT